MKLFNIAFLVCVICANYVVYGQKSSNWAVLVAGSNEYYNYRHQADICHAYQILHRNGVPDEQIIVMMYDDIANNPENPTKGVIINKPNGNDVYNGTLKDYTAESVTPENFLKVLQAQKTKGGNGKVLKSGPNDNVFVYFSDHGAPGLIAFPSGDVLYANDLIKAIINMHNNGQYKNLVFYLEACESGSMFDGLLPNNISVYATTAANSDESSYACYFDDLRQTYLGDLYSVNWMENSENENINKESLQQQYQSVKSLTNLSHVMEFGNLTMSEVFTVSQFIKGNTRDKIKTIRPLTNSNINPNFDAIKSEDVRLTVLERRLAAENDEEKRTSILNEINRVKEMKDIAVSTITKVAYMTLKYNNEMFNNVMNSRRKLTNHKCYQSSVSHLFKKCFTAKNEYALRQLYVLVNLCENGIRAEKINDKIDKICPKKLNI